jgi:hypothetical protein
MNKRGRPSNKEEREKNIEREADHVIDSWLWLLEERIEATDRLVKYIFNDLALIGMNRERAIMKLSPIVMDMIHFHSNKPTEKGR